MEVGEEGDYIPIATLSPYNDSCIKMGSDESHFNVSRGSDGQSDKTVSTNHNFSEEKGEQKRYRTEVLPLTRNLTARPNRLTTDYLNACVFKASILTVNRCIRTMDF